ncbi:Transcription factor MYB3 [Vitis vinifera]|uniref:Transcription factor MYB3 n=1 Tax=Vitis vinifera TaxID=29760 RepID=A0A438H5X9_VITVI|nr:Transcription factor MYB3 [Vitis vinifera]
MARPEQQKPRWTEEEDRVLFECKSRNDNLPWPVIAKLAGLSRSGKSCRERWKNHLHPNVKRGNFSQEEDETIIRLHSSHGNSWAFIADRLPGRTDNAVKNRWNQHLKNKLIGRGIDHQNIPDPQSSTGDQPHATQLFDFNHNIDPNANSGSIPTPGYLPSDDETIHHSFGGDYFGFEPTQLFDFNHNIDPYASSGSIPTPVSASQEIANPWSTSQLAYPEFQRGCLPSDDETIHHSFGGDYFGFEPTQLFDFNHNIDPNASSGSIPTPVSASQEIANPWSTSQLAYPEFQKGYLPSDDETIHHSFGGNSFEF